MQQAPASLTVFLERTRNVKNNNNKRDAFPEEDKTTPNFLHWAL